ncbi:hypothetical protein PV328_010345 [Microctonus aethiopoides]|uniref:Uncharacterized protein n=1 Tax=Microctonus aethiopoides TaxID=144406 RepID=A0AA39FHR6_9HYME|nr:hypothetical protein PV328_010345 [Microctonus aethiopoides]
MPRHRIHPKKSQQGLIIKSLRSGNQYGDILHELQHNNITGQNISGSRRTQRESTMTVERSPPGQTAIETTESKAQNETGSHMDSRTNTATAGDSQPLPIGSQDNYTCCSSNGARPKDRRMNTSQVGNVEHSLHNKNDLVNLYGNVQNEQNLHDSLLQFVQHPNARHINFTDQEIRNTTNEHHDNNNQRENNTLQQNILLAMMNNNNGNNMTEMITTLQEECLANQKRNRQERRTNEMSSQSRAPDRVSLSANDSPEQHNQDMNKMFAKFQQWYLHEHRRENHNEDVPQSTYCQPGWNSQRTATNNNMATRWDEINRQQASRYPEQNISNISTPTMYTNNPVRPSYTRIVKSWDIKYPDCGYEAEDFLKEIECRMHADNIPIDQGTQLLRDLFTGHVLMWYRASYEYWTDWQMFRTEFLDSYATHREDEDVLIKIA